MPKLRRGSSLASPGPHFANYSLRGLNQGANESDAARVG